MEKLKIVFMGTPDFAVPCLARLLEDGHTVSLAVTQADKPKGRGHQLAAPPVKEFALLHNIPVYQPATLRGEEATLRLAAEQADVFVVVAYGKLLPSALLSMPRYGCINVHGSLLPKYRGAAPIQWTVLNGDAEGGVTTMRMDEGMDTGDMLLTARVPVSSDMTAGELYEKLAPLGASLLSETLTRLIEGSLVPQKQVEALATHAPMLSRALSPLDFSLPAATLHNTVRGLNPWPSAICRLDGKTLKIHTSRVGGAVDAAPGTVVKLNPFTVACGSGTSLELLEVQYEGGKRMDAVQFLRGHAVALGCVLSGKEEEHVVV